jgi:hypothetical protein
LSVGKIPRIKDVSGNRFSPAATNLMSPKFGSYLFRNLKGQTPETNSPGDSLGAFGAFEEQPILLRQEDIRADDPKGPPLDWSNVENGQITVQLKETQGIADGSVTVRASTLRRLCPLLIPHPFEEDHLYPVSLKTVVLQIQTHLQRKSSDLPKPSGPDFDTPIAQVAREDEGFFKLEKVAHQPSLPDEKPKAQQTSTEPFLTPADRPSFPLIREKPRLVQEGSAIPPLEIALQHPAQQVSGSTPSAPSKPGPFDDLPKVGPEILRVKKLEVTPDPSAIQEREEAVQEAEVSDHAQRPVTAGPPVQKPPRRAGLERLQEIFMTEDLLDAREVAALIACFPKVSGALIFLSDGSLMGGELPKTFRVDATLLAPMVLRSAQEFGLRLKSQKPSAITVFLDQPVSLISAGNVCILVSHEGRGLLPGMRERICDVAKALDMLFEHENCPNP